MGKALAWDIMNNVVWPRVNKNTTVKATGTIYSTKDWENGVALSTNKGEVHVLGTGEVIDENNILNY